MVIPLFSVSAISFLSVLLRLLTKSGGLAAFIVGFPCSVDLSYVTLIFWFFISSNIFSKMGEQSKVQISDEYRKSIRGAKQVYYIGLIPSLFAWIDLLGQIGCIPNNSSWYLQHEKAFFIFAVHYAASNSDTWASEVGALSVGKVRLITNMKEVPKGTDGGISLLGTFAAVLGSLSIAVLANYFSSGILWPVFIIGFIGNIFDSVW
ncbi:hypothetical protein PCE1_001777 [Barthelona sp. PCE]